MFSRFLRYVVVLLIVNIYVTGAVSAQALNNDQIRAEFDEEGLVSIHDIELNRTLTFTEDHWTVQINDEEISGKDRSPDSHSQGKNQINYIYRTGRFTINVVYKLEPGWRFISKRLIVNDSKEGEYRVDRVTVFQGNLGTAVDEEHVIKTANANHRKYRDVEDFGAFLRFDASWGAFFLVQNPFLTWQRDGRDFSITYDVDMPWKSEYGPFKSDRGNIGTYRLTGHRTPGYMESHPEWKMADKGNDGTGQFDKGEVNAFIDCVSEYLLYEPEKSVDVHVPWTENDYQIDVAKDKGTAEWKRIVDMASQLGIDHMVYSPRNTAVATRDEARDAWSWEHLLWLNMGPKIRRAEWDPAVDPLPVKTRELLRYADEKGVKLMAYVYPTLPFEQNKDWLVERANTLRPDPVVANTGFREFQDWLIENLTTFKKRFGLSGYAFDYWNLRLQEGPSEYAQWYGTRRILNELRRRNPDIIIDGRQSYHNYGPWTYVAGTYPHPTAGDEQPESFEPFPDLHFDRSSATFQRYTAYWYRNTQFTPIEVMPGFITHQSARKDSMGVAHFQNFNVRDWDYMGWKFSLFSSLATSPFNHVVSMIPARDKEEFKHFPEEDKQFIRRWFKWTDEHRQVLKNMQTIMGPPGLGKTDGTAAIDEDHGFIFLFNPNHRKVTAEFTLNEEIGLTKGRQFTLEYLYPEKGKKIGSDDQGTFKYGDQVTLRMDGTTAMVLKLSPIEDRLQEPMLFNARGAAELEDGILVLNDVMGEVGTDPNLLVKVPSGRDVQAVKVNGTSVSFRQEADLVKPNVRFAGQHFAHNHQVGQYDPDFDGRTVEGTFTIPERIFDQLEERRQRWPIPWTKKDYETPWLVPERLLLYVQIYDPDWKMNVNLKIDGDPVKVKKAYSSITPGRLKMGKGNNTFVGFYADVTSLKPGVEHTVELTLPSNLKPGQFQGMFFENVISEYTQNIMVTD